MLLEFHSDDRVIDGIDLKKDCISYCKQGLQLLELKKYEEAEVIFNKAIGLDPTSINAYLHLGFALNITKKYDEAVNCYLKVLEFNPYNTEAIEHLADIFYVLKNDFESEKYYRKCLEIYPLYCNSYKNLGLLFKRMNRINEAIYCFRKADLLEKYDYEDIIKKNLIEILIQVGKGRETEKLHRKLKLHYQIII